MAEKKNMFAKQAKKREDEQSQIKDMLTGDKSKKNKIISVKVNPDIWERFQNINSICGSTSNGMLNQLITNYVYAKEKELKDLNVL